jgi:hypothetical protein
MAKYRRRGSNLLSVLKGAKTLVFIDYGTPKVTRRKTGKEIRAMVDFSV